MEDQTAVLESVAKLVNEHFNGDIEEADRILDALGGHGDYASFGIECTHEDWMDRELLYLNTGDTYNVTIMVEDGSNELFVGDWGSWYEDMESEYCVDNDAIRCGYCGEFTPVDKGCWSDTVCEHCDNLVGG